MRSFSWQCEVNTFLSVESPLQPQFLTDLRIFLHTLPSLLNKLFQSLACLSSCVPPPFKQLYVSSGLSTWTNPTRTSLPWETLGFRCIGFSPMFSLLMPTFSLLPRPQVLPILLRPTTVRSPTHIVSYMTQFRLYALVPVYFRRGVA